METEIRTEERHHARNVNRHHTYGRIGTTDDNNQENLQVYDRIHGRRRSSYLQKLVVFFCGATFLASTSLAVFLIYWIIEQSTHDVSEGFPGSEFGWRSQSTQNNKLRIVLCAKVTLENPYLIEWIEFHRLQGVDKFVLYHDAIPSDPITVASALELEWLTVFYRDVERRFKSNFDNRSMEDFIEVQSSSVLMYDTWPELKTLPIHTSISHRQLQHLVVTDCVERYKNKADYIMHIDVDEFVYSVKHDTIWDYLQSRRILWRTLIYGRSVGFYIPSFNFGSSGVLWDFHNFWSPDSSTGTVSLYYDPRDSSFFQLLQKSNISSDAPIGTQLDHLRLSRLLDQHRIPTSNTSQFADHLQRVMVKDFSLNASSKPFLESLSIPANPAAKSMDYTLSELFQSVNSALVRLRQNVSLKIQNKQQKSLSDRVMLYQFHIKNSALFYPLIIEEQIRRGPSEFADIDRRGAAVRLSNHLFPICYIRESHRTQFLIDHEGFLKNSTELEKTVTLYNQLCAGKMPGSITRRGKVIYDTESIKRSQSTRTSGRLRGCHRPSIHACSHMIYGGHLDYVSSKNGLRLDHHQFRSYQRRTFGLPRWRGGPVGYAHQTNYTILQTFLDSIVDTGKLKFVSRIRERLKQFQVLPKMPDYVLATKQENQEIIEISIDRYNITRKCSAIELLGEYEIMCPSDYPYVGYYYTRVVPPNPYLPYGWCSNIPMNLRENPWHGTFDTVDAYPNENNQTYQDRLDNHTVICPGFGEIRCCDFDPSLLVYQSTKFSYSPRVWSPTINVFSSLFYSQ